jgi:hypothetical protein
MYGRGATLAAVLVVVLVSGGALAQNGPAGDPPAETVFKNIKVLTGVPRSELIDNMHFMRASLGVRCDFCHVAENGKYDLDDKKEKQTARKMITMVAEINRANFEGRTVVTCQTCHRGSPRPVSVPSFTQANFDDVVHAPASTDPPLPAVDAVLAAYDRAAGGDAARGVRTRHSTGTILEPLIVDAGTPRARAIGRADRAALDVYQKSPDKFLMVVRYADGSVVERGYDGTTGWIKTPQAVRALSPAESARLRTQADPAGDLRLRERYHELRVTGRDTLRDHDAIAVQGLDAQNRRVRLFFDERSGLLLRTVTLRPIRVGVDPVAIDYDDYRRVGPANVPYRVDTITLDEPHRGLTETFTRVRNDDPLDDALFARPPAPPTPAPSAPPSPSASSSPTRAPGSR